MTLLTSALWWWGWRITSMKTRWTVFGRITRLLTSCEKESSEKNLGKWNLARWQSQLWPLDIFSTLLICSDLDEIDAHEGFKTWKVEGWQRLWRRERVHPLDQVDRCGRIEPNNRQVRYYRFLSSPPLFVEELNFTPLFAYYKWKAQKHNLIGQIRTKDTLLD